MALKSTVYKCEVGLSDIDANRYLTIQCRLARHPSETLERMMIRLLVYAVHYSEGLEFGKGLSTVDEPDIWQHDLTGQIQLWIETGLPAEDRVIKASRVAEKVYVYCYGSENKQQDWIDSHKKALVGVPGLSVFTLVYDKGLLESIAARQMQVQLTLQEGSWLLANDADSLVIECKEIELAQ